MRGGYCDSMNCRDQREDTLFAQHKGVEAPGLAWQTWGQESPIRLLWQMHPLDRVFASK